MARIISQQEAADIAGVTKQGLSKLQKTRKFFTNTKPKKVDTEHSDWHNYLLEREEEQNNISDSMVGYGNFVPTSIRDQKTHAEATLKIIQIHEELKRLVDRKYLDSYQDSINRLVQQAFVDAGKRLAPIICSKLQRTGMEKVVTELINKDMRKGIETVQVGSKKALQKCGK